MSVAVFLYDYSTSGVAYSGGRYHALMLAYAMAHRGIDVTVIGDRPPAFVNDLKSAYEAPVRFVFTPSYDASALTGGFDYVFVAPTGGFNPAFYACAEVAAGRSKATPVLINYESANWFNSVAPTPDHLAVWDYWRRTVVRGGIVLSSTLEADAHARHYYRSDRCPLHFAQCYPPLNTKAATQALADLQGKDGSLIYFARPFHDHKGGDDILEFPSDIWKGRILRVIVGGQIDEKYCNLLDAKVKASGGRLAVYSRISEYEKFKLLAHASLHLFPSRFEGFGYPPLEAALVGTETVCYDLPVLRETLGDCGRFAPVGNVLALAERARHALASPMQAEVLRDRAAGVAGFGRIAQLISRELASWPTVPAIVDQHVVQWGPWTTQEIQPGRSTSPEDDVPLPPYGTVSATSSGSLVLTIILWVSGTIARATVMANDLAIPALATDSHICERQWKRWEVQIQLSRQHLGQRMRLECHDKHGKQLYLDNQFMVSEVGR